MLVAAIPSKLQAVLERLRSSFGSKAEDAYRNRDSADTEGSPQRRAFAAGEAHAHGEDEDSVRDAQADADK